MIYTGGNPSTLFCEQVSTVTELFEKWSDCERTVVMYALLKRLRYPSLKFLQYSIDNNLTQNFGSQDLAVSNVNANNPGYLQQLVNTYKCDDDPIIYGSEKEDEKTFNKKGNILNDVLDLIPLLRPGNDEAKIIYLSLIPLAVEDTSKKIVDTGLVQQIFSYLLIHPAITNDDRRSLGQWLHHLEENIQSSFPPAAQPNFFVLSNPMESYTKSGSVSSLSNDSVRSWQTIAPPSQNNNKHQNHHQPQQQSMPPPPPQQQQQQQQQQAPAPLQQAPPHPVPAAAQSLEPNDWSSHLFQIPDNLCEDIHNVSLADDASSRNRLGLIYNETRIQSENSNDDHHVSFSKNGTEIIDFESNDDCDKCSNSINYNSLFSNVCDHVNAPRWTLDTKIGGFKTRRSNSLTTATIGTSSSSVINTIDNCSNSSENLAQYAQKPRSFSLSIENTRSNLTSSGSDTRLDDYKPNYLKFTTHNIGMSNIGQWLKSLRLHKYIGLFTNMTYEDMLDITEDYLQSLGVTKGASHKLAICIEKLKDRHNRLTNIEQDLLGHTVTITAVVEELANIVLTPMKPANSKPNNVAGKFIQVLDLACNLMAKNEMMSTQDEDCLNVLLWILERCIHNEAFVAHTNQLKEHKFKLSKLKMQFTTKNPHLKTVNNPTLTKPRWNGKSRKPDKCSSTDRIHRKSSSDITFILNPSQAHNITSQIPHDDKYHSVKPAHTYNSCQQYKSSSFPNFSNAGIKTTFHPTVYNNKHHRHSLNNLIMVSPNPQQIQQTIFRLPKQQSVGVLHISKICNNSTIDNKHPRSNLRKSSVPTVTAVTSSQVLASVVTDIVTMASSSSSSSAIENSSTTTSNTVSSTNSNFNRVSVLSSSHTHDKSSNTIGDINSSLEFLCLQMTEQAIN